MLSDVSDRDLLACLDTLVKQGRIALAELLAHIGEVESRRLFLPAAQPSMLDYLTRRLGFSYDAALRRLRAARTARRLPMVFAAVAEGQLDLTAVVLLAPHLAPENAEELIALCAFKSRAEVQSVLARRSAEQSRQWRHGHGGAAPNRAPQVAPAPLSPSHSEEEADSMGPLFGGFDPPPLREEREWIPLPRQVVEKIQKALELAGHSLPVRTRAAAVERALDEFIARTERRRYGKTSSPRMPRPVSASGRVIPAHIRRAVAERDGYQCAFVGEDGQRCPSRANLEFDHIIPVAKGGTTTVSNLRLCCRAHNQYAAEQVFGADFMRGKRAWARSRQRDPRSRRSGTPSSAPGPRS